MRDEIEPNRGIRAASSDSDLLVSSSRDEILLIQIGAGANRIPWASGTAKE